MAIGDEHDARGRIERLALDASICGAAISYLTQDNTGELKTFRSRTGRAAFRLRSNNSVPRSLKPVRSSLL